uniref:Uncharacterized protein n=1 Tax=Geoglobus ahangari TaxID=113653 RepID=A0A7C4S830_9EURY
MIWYYRPYKNPVARNRYLLKLSPLYAVVFFIVLGRFLRYGFSSKFVIPLIPLFVMLIFFTLLIMMKPKYGYTDEQFVHFSGKRIEKWKAKFKPDFEKLTVDVEVDGKSFKLYFENREDMNNFLRDVGALNL